MSLSERQQVLAQTTLELCGIASVTGNEKEICDWVQNRFVAHAQWQVTRHKDSIFVSPHDRRENKSLVILAGHLDTVPPRQDRPPNIQGDWLEACGASDMKGALAVMLHLAETLKIDALPVDLALAFYGEEEGAYERNQLRLLLDQEPLLHQAALVICMEPTDNSVQVGCVGGIHATLTFSGRRAHSARPWQGENAIHAAGPLLNRLRQQERRAVSFGPLTFYEVATVTMAHKTGTRNVVPDEFQLNLNYRFAPGKTLEQGQQDIIDLIDGECDVTFRDLAPSGHTCLDNPLLRSLLAKTGDPEPKQAWTDVAQFSAIGIDAVNCGPGAPAQAHQQNEGIRIQALGESYDLLAGWLAALG
jgi:succinyl-diaminopimelate desuccinylase